MERERILEPTGDFYELPAASETELGGITVGAGLSMDGETLNCAVTPYILPTASPSTKGDVKIGEGLSMVSDVLNVTVKRNVTVKGGGGNYSIFGGATEGAIPSRQE